MTNDPSSAAREPINPYAASHVADSQETPPPAKAELARTYQVRMEWADRKRFLRCVGLLRIAAVAGAVVGFYGLYGLLSGFYSSWQIGDIMNWFQPVMAGRWLFVVAKVGIAFYICWLNWSLGDAIAATAGGTTGRMDDWSVIQLRLAVLALVTIAVGVLSLGWDWLTMQFLSTTRLGI